MLTSFFGLLSKFKPKQSGSPKPIVMRASPTSVNGTADANSNKELIDYICQSPLLDVCGITRETVEKDIQAWKSFGNHCIEDLKLPPYDHLTPADKNRIFQYYLPVFFWCRHQLQQHRDNPSSEGPLVIGISAPQGCGKSTLCEQLQSLFAFEERQAVAISIDDFYLTYDGQQSVATTYKDNPLLQYRGNAGSHDLPLGEQTLNELHSAHAKFGTVAIPRYNKSAYAGRGDRFATSEWHKVQGQVDVVLFEGWMLGFRPVGSSAAAAVDANLVPVDKFLEAYESAWDSHCDCWLVIKVKDPSYAYKWRLQAEVAMREQGKAAMTDEQVKEFVDRFMPAYKCYLPGLYAKGPTTATAGKLLLVEVDEKRAPIVEQPKALM